MSRSMTPSSIPGSPTGSRTTRSSPGAGARDRAGCLPLDPTAAPDAGAVEVPDHVHDHPHRRSRRHRRARGRRRAYYLVDLPNPQSAVQARHRHPKCRRHPARSAAGLVAPTTRSPVPMQQAATRRLPVALSTRLRTRSARSYAFRTGSLVIKIKFPPKGCDIATCGTVDINTATVGMHADGCTWDTASLTAEGATGAVECTNAVNPDHPRLRTGSRSRSRITTQAPADISRAAPGGLPDRQQPARVRDRHRRRSRRRRRRPSRSRGRNVSRGRCSRCRRSGVSCESWQTSWLTAGSGRRGRARAARRAARRSRPSPCRSSGVKVMPRKSNSTFAPRSMIARWWSRTGYESAWPMTTRARSAPSSSKIRSWSRPTEDWTAWVVIARPVRRPLEPPPDGRAPPTARPTACRSRSRR